MVGVVPDDVTYIQLQPNGSLPNVANQAPFKAIVVIEGVYKPEWQDEVSRWLVESGCRYMMAWGPDCSSWDDSVDYASILSSPGAETPDDKFIMTTWHENESLEGVFWYSQFCAQFSYDDVELINTVIIHISQTNRDEWMKALFERSKTLAEREPD